MRWISLVFIGLLAASAASAIERKSARELMRERGEQVDRDVDEDEDPEARYREQRKLNEGETSDAALLARMRAARLERDRGVSRTQGSAPRSFAPYGAAAAVTPAVQGNAWINLGPDNADIAQDGPGPVDSGRMRSIVPHPGNPDIIYIATAGGGVWKTYDGAASWIPITDRLGALGSGALAMDPNNPDVLVYGLGDPFDATLAASGVTVTTDGGNTWSDPQPQTLVFAGQATVARSVRDLKIDGTDSRHIVAATNVGLFQSFDFGATWHPAALPAAVEWSAWSVGYLGAGACPSGSGVCSSWLAATQRVDDVYGEVEMHLFRSGDSGATWSEVALWPGETRAAGRATIAVAPSTTYDSGLARVYVVASTSNPPDNWTPYNPTTRDVYRSDDGARSFRGLGVNRNAVPLDGSPDVNGLDVLSFQSWYNQSIAVDAFDPNTVMIGGMLALIRTTDGGASWSVVSDWLPIAEGIALPYVHSDHHAMASVGYPGAETTRFFFGSDGGLFRSDDLHVAPVGQGHVSSAINRGVVTHLIYSVACAKDSWPEYLQGFALGGLQDNGTRMRALPALYSSATTPGTFNLIFGGDGFGVGVTRALGVGPNAPPALTITTTFGGASFSPIHATVDGGKTWKDLGGGIDPTTLPFRMQIATDDAPDSDGATFLTFSTANRGAAHVFRITNATVTTSWTKIDGTTAYPDGTSRPYFLNPFGTAATPHNLGTHQKKSGIYGFTADSGAVFVTNDAGAHWRASQPLGTCIGASCATQQTNFIKGAAGLDFDWSDTTGNTLWVGSTAASLSDAKNNNIPGTVPDSWGHLFHTTDAGMTWTPVHGSGLHALPNVEVNTVKVDPMDPQTVYVGTYLGLYVTHDNGATFDRMGEGLPLASVTDICVTASTGSIKISTYGRGFWEIDQHAAGLQAGAHGHGDMDFNQRIDAFDLIDLVSRMGTTNQSDRFRQEADLTGDVAAIDDADLAALLTRVGGTP